MKNKRKYTWILTAACLVLSAGIPAGAWAAPAGEGTVTGRLDSDRAVTDTLAGDRAVTGTLAGDQSLTVQPAVEVSNEDQLRAAIGHASDETVSTIRITETIVIRQPLDITGKSIVLQGVSEKVSLKAVYAPAANTDSIRTLLTVGRDAVVTISGLDIDANETGRGIYVQNGGDLTLETGAAVINGRNTCDSRKAFGIGLYVADGGHVSMREGAAIRDNANAYDAEGVGVCNVGTFFMSGGSICDNLGEEGAVSRGIGVNNAGSFIMKGGEISQNTGNSFAEQKRYTEDADAEDADAEDMYADAEDMYAEGADAENAGLERMTRGGAICQSGGNLMISGDSGIYGNTADLGGGIFSQGGSVSITGSNVTICENRACAGGAAYICGVQSDMYSSLWLNGAMIEDNEAVVTDMALSGNGAGIYVDGGRVTMVSGNIRDNRIVNDRTEEENRADPYSAVKGYGGGVYLAGCDGSGARVVRSVLDLNGGVISGNTASEGGGIYAANYCLDMDKVCYGNSEFYVKGAPKVLDNAGGDIVLSPVKQVLDEALAANVYPQTIRATGELQVLDEMGKISCSAVLPVYKEPCQYVDIDGKTKTDNVLIEDRK